MEGFRGTVIGLTGEEVCALYSFMAKMMNEIEEGAGGFTPEEKSVVYDLYAKLGVQVIKEKGK
jgi:hypothetical protein